MFTLSLVQEFYMSKGLIRKENDRNGHWLLWTKRESVWFTIKGQNCEYGRGESRTRHFFIHFFIHNKKIINGKKSKSFFHNQKKNCHYDHIPFNWKRIENRFLWERMLTIFLGMLLIQTKFWLKLHISDWLNTKLNCVCC